MTYTDPVHDKADAISTLVQTADASFRAVDPASHNGRIPSGDDAFAALLDAWNVIDAMTDLLNEDFLQPLGTQVVRNYP